MANTIKASKNTFGGGLVMDLAPDTTPNEVLTSALNATLVTFNGNELSLQNDMGNGRVETARLPEGYIPVGTCEFGDIIYIVSYNPLTNKSQIGCFPSPERNISSEEIGSTEQTLTSSDFLEVSNGSPTGKLVASSVKKIIYENKLNPGDKFIIYDLNNQILKQTHITDIGNTSHIYGSFPKLLKIHVVAIEDSGKINYLNSTLKWYDNLILYDNNYDSKDYFIVSLNTSNTNGKIDIDSYRDNLNSGYSIFQSKVSGKLALLIELEKITGFSCTYNIFTKDDTPILDSREENISTKKCNVYWNISWNTDDNNINPSYIVLTKSQLAGKKPDQKGKWYSYQKNSAGVYINNVSNEYTDTQTLPKPYPQNDYWYTSISLSYNPSATDTYQDFIESKSYEKVLDNQLSDIRDTTIELTKYPYKNVALTKLSIRRDNSDYKSLPVLNGNKGTYYINASSMGYDNSNNPVVYTPDAINGRNINITNTTFDINDDIVNNYFHASVYKEFADFVIPFKLTLDGIEFTPDISNLIYNYEITPAMSYGLLLEYAIEGYIDFSKIGSGKIDLTKWKYYNTENNSTLTIGLDAYTEENMGIAEVVLEFYDNLGFAAGYHIIGKESYSGTFTEYLPLNGSSQNFKLNAYNALNPNNKQIHAGARISNLEGYTEAVYLDNNRPLKLYINENRAYTDSNHATLYNGNIYEDDCGTLYSNIVYLVKIIVKYCPYNALGLLDTSDTSNYKTFYRWYWTNTMYNEYYYNTLDFKDLKFNLTLDLTAQYKTNDNYVYKKYNYESTNNDVIIDSSLTYSLLSANVQVISSKFTSSENTRTYTNNTELSIDAGLNNTYNTFSLRGLIDENNYSGAFKNVYIDIITDGKLYVENTIETPEILHAGESTLLESSTIYPTLSEDGLYDKSKYGPRLKGYLEEAITVAGGLNNDEIYASENSYKNYKNQFNITFAENSTEIDNNNDQYITYSNEVSDFDRKHKITKSLKDIYGSKHLDLNTEIIHFSKYYNVKGSTQGSKQVIEPVLRTQQNIDDYGLYLPPSEYAKPFFVKHMLQYALWDDGDSTQSHVRVHKWLCNDYGNFTGQSDSYWGKDWKNDEDHSLFKNHSYQCLYRDDWENWLSFCPQGFCLISLESTSDTAIRINKLNAKNSLEWDVDYNFRKYYGGFGNATYIENGRTKYHSTRLDASGKDWCSFAGDEYTGGATLLNIAFRGDKDDNIHMFNNWCLVNEPNHILQQEARFDRGSYPVSNYPTEIGNLIASILANIYVYSSSSGDSTTIKYTSDVVYLADNYTTFTKDIIYKIYVDSNHYDHNDLININGISYSDYIGYIKDNSGIDSTEYNNIDKSNVNLNLLSAIKNIPIQFKVNYSSPDLGSLRYRDDLGGIVTVRKIDGTSEDIAGEIEQDKLYYIKDVLGSKSIALLDPEFIPKYLSGAVLTPEGIIGTFDPNVQFTLKFSEVWKMFNFVDGKLLLSAYTAPGSSQNCYAIVTEEENHMALFHLLKSEVLIPYFRFIY